MAMNQFFNHFPDTRELTTKEGLNRNLYSITEPGVDVHSFYPRSYDLSQRKQFEEFLQDFNQTAIFNCIKKH
jgi:tubulin monoglycylase TTLL3/8